MMLDQDISGGYISCPVPAQHGALWFSPPAWNGWNSGEGGLNFLLYGLQIPSRKRGGVGGGGGGGLQMTQEWQELYQ